MIHAVCIWFEAHPVLFGAVLGLAADDLTGVFRVVWRHVKRRRAASPRRNVERIWKDGV